MRKITPLSKMAVKLLPASLLLAMAMPAHSVWIDQPGVKNGMQFLVYNSVYPRITTTSNKFNYTLGDPAYFGTAGTLAQVLANQDRQDSDERYRLAGMSALNTQFVVRQVLNKDWTAVANLYIAYNPNGANNWGVPWGMGMQYKRDAYFTIGNTNPGIGTSRTDADSLLNNAGTYFTAEYTGLNNLTLTASHSLTAADDVRDNSDFGWHKNNGLSVEYDFNFAPRNKLSVGLAGTRSRGHKSPLYTNQPAKNNAYMASLAYEYGNLTLGADYGKGQEKFNGAWFDELDKTSYGVKASYKITPRLTGSLSYSHFEADNNKPVSLQNIVGRRIGLNETRYFFDKTVTERYKAEASYNVWRGLSVIGSVESAKNRHYVTEGEFAKRETVTATAGARFTF